MSDHDLRDSQSPSADVVGGRVEVPPVEGSRVAMIAMARADAATLNAWEGWATSAPPPEFQEWTRSFAADPSLLRSAPPAEVAALLRVVDHHPGWVEEDTRQRLTFGVVEQLGDTLDTDVVQGSRVHAVDEVRKAQNPGLAAVRAELLDSLDAAFDDVQQSGASVQTALAKVLHERGLVTLDAELGEPVERVGPAVRHVAAEHRMPPPLGRGAPGQGMDR